nr:cell division cycle protein 48 homolog [Tanacetum cinerariifolium]
MSNHRESSSSKRKGPPNRLVVDNVIELNHPHLDMSNHQESSSSKRKGPPNRLVVDNAFDEKSSYVAMHPTTIAKLQILQRRNILIKDMSDNVVSSTIAYE